METVGIIGFGRFGQVLADILIQDFKVMAYDVDQTLTYQGVDFVDLKTLLALKTIFVAVPIRHFKDTITQIANDLGEQTTIVDVCSIKVYPTQLMQEKLPNHVGIIATHPLFGPDSITANSTLTMMMHPARDTHGVYEKWKTFFSKQPINIIEMTPDEHDRAAARSQGITHFLGRVLAEAEISPTPIDTLGFKKLLEIIDVTCNDTWELFSDLQHYNPHTAEMLVDLQDAIAIVHRKLIDSQIY